MYKEREEGGERGDLSSIMTMEVVWRAEYAGKGGAAELLTTLKMMLLDPFEST